MGGALPTARAALGLAGLALFAACVTSGTHEEVVQERDRLAAAKRQLEEQVKRLDASNEALGEERLRLLDEMEDLRQRRLALEADVRRLDRRSRELVESLEEREAELASRSEEIAAYEGLVDDLESEVASGQIQIEQLREGLRLNLSQEVLFASGEWRVRPSGREVLGKVSDRLRELPNRIEVQGHTDDVPIRSSARDRFPSNWELAAARASDVVRLLESQGIDPGRMTAVSYGEHAPVASNETPEGRARNRRIEIRLLPVARDEVPAESAEAAAP